uniref:Uncharacterized protein n=1 Tax=Arundo donax TaxID=35708 RepID=A0A0A9HEQ1_ARUDO
MPDEDFYGFRWDAWVFFFKVTLQIGRLILCNPSSNQYLVHLFCKASSPTPISHRAPLPFPVAPVSSIFLAVATCRSCLALPPTTTAGPVCLSQPLPMPGSHRNT